MTTIIIIIMITIIIIIISSSPVAVNRIGIDNARGALSTRLNPVVPTLKTRSAGEALRFLTAIDAANTTAVAPSKKDHSSTSTSSSDVDGINLNANLVNTSSLMVYDMKSDDKNESFKRHLPFKLSEQTPGKILAARRKEQHLRKMKQNDSDTTSTTIAQHAIP